MARPLREELFFAAPLTLTHSNVFLNEYFAIDICLRIYSLCDPMKDKYKQLMSYCIYEMGVFM